MSSMSSSTTATKKTIAILGATGQQGGSLLRHILASPKLSSTFNIRALTRDPSSPSAQALLSLPSASENPVTLVQADIASPSTLVGAFSRVDFIFAVTVPSYNPTTAIEDEFAAIKSIADAAVEAPNPIVVDDDHTQQKTGKETTKFIIFSTLPSLADLSGGKYTRLTPFEAKAKGEKYIRSLSTSSSSSSGAGGKGKGLLKSAFWSGGFFLQNLHTQPFLAPRFLSSERKWVLERPVPGSTRLPYLDIRDIGFWIEPILLATTPSEYESKTIVAAEGWYELSEIARLLGEYSEEKEEVEFREVGGKEFAKGLPKGLLGDMFVEGMEGLGGLGYWGPGSEEMVEEGLRGMGKERRGKLVGMRGYLEENNVRLSQ